MVNFPTWILKQTRFKYQLSNSNLDCDSHSPVLLDLFISSDTSICSAMVFTSLEKSDHVVSISIEFPLNSKENTLFHCTAYDYSCADWEHLHDPLRDVP